MPPENVDMVLANTSAVGGDPSNAPVVILGAGPAGLTAASALVERGMKPIVLEMDPQVGGISKTIAYNGNRMDIGGHRFFSKNDRVMRWWLEVLPLQSAPSRDDVALRRDVPLGPGGAAHDPEATDAVMLSRSRLSRIYFLRRFFDYPVSLRWATLSNLGLGRTLSIGMSYLAARLAPHKPERSLEDFMVNRFGRTLYQLFFRDYTEKVWGVPCTEIQPEWGAQRIKNLSVAATIKHALAAPLRRAEGVSQKGVETSFIGRFLYPKLGPGQLWESVADSIVSRGGSLRLSTEVVGIEFTGGRASAVRVRDSVSGAEERVACSAVLSTLPVRDLVGLSEGVDVPADVARVAQGLKYRDFVTCGLLISKLKVTNPDGSRILDNWIYVQEPDVRLGRIQVFNNWSPYLVADVDKMWLGLEYFCDEGDELWSMPDEEFVELAKGELARIGIAEEADVLDATVMRVRKAYPAYFGTFTEFETVREWLDTLPNVFVMGRNGMHRYNNMDHSMLSAWAAVNALLGSGSREQIWDVNAEEDYQEEG